MSFAGFTAEFVFKVRQLGLTDLELRREFRMSQPALERWKEGTSAPHPGMQIAVLKWLDEQLLKKP